jgi:hypothetical protein
MRFALISKPARALLTATLAVISAGPFASAQSEHGTIEKAPRLQRFASLP